MNTLLKEYITALTESSTPDPYSKETFDKAIKTPLAEFITRANLEDRIESFIGKGTPKPAVGIVNSSGHNAISDKPTGQRNNELKDDEYYAVLDELIRQFNTYSQKDSEENLLLSFLDSNAYAEVNFDKPSTADKNKIMDDLLFNYWAEAREAIL